MTMAGGDFKRAQVIRAGDGAATQWSPPDVGGRSVQEQNDAPPLLTASELEALAAKAQKEGLEQGRKEGFEYGHREGLEAGRREMLARLETLDQLIAALSEPFQDLDQQVEQEIVSLVIAMVRQLVRREIKTDPGQIVGVVREALGILPVNARRIRVLLHPDDAQIVREAYTLGETDQKWQIIEDPVIQRGGCRVFTENSQIDATLESRLNALIAPLLGSERESGDAAQRPAQ
jgi:flagellar assembly protein FliH